jgi:hypothetical protein
MNYIIIKMESEKSFEQLYLDSLNEKEMKSYLIAKEHLGTSFQLEKSVGFLKWKKKMSEQK